MVCRKPEKIIDREFVNNFSNHVGSPPPPGQKEVHCLWLGVQGIIKKLLSKKNEPKSNSQTGWIAVNVYVPFGPWTNSPPWSKKQFHLTLTHLWIRLL